MNKVSIRFASASDPGGWLVAGQAGSMLEVARLGMAAPAARLHASGHLTLPVAAR